VIPVVYAARYRIDIGLHVFPTLKFELVCRRLLETGVVQPSDIVEPQPASRDDLALVHTSDYLTRLHDGTLSVDEQALLELPASPRSWRDFV